MGDLTPEALAAEWEARAVGYGATKIDRCAKELRERLAPAHAALTGQLAVMTAARDDLARELDAALKTVSRWQDENQRLIEERDAAQGRERMATMALAEEITELRAHRDQLRRERDEAINRAAEVGDERNRFGAALAEIADPTASFTWDGGTDPPADRLGRINHAREALEGGQS